MSSSVISVAITMLAVSTVAVSAQRNCTESEERELARRHARCVDSGECITQCYVCQFES